LLSEMIGCGIINSVNRDLSGYLSARKIGKQF